MLDESMFERTGFAAGAPAFVLADGPPLRVKKNCSGSVTEQSCRLSRVGAGGEKQ